MKSTKLFGSIMKSTGLFGSLVKPKDFFYKVYSDKSSPGTSRPRLKLSGKVAIVTGAAQGLGKAFCEILLKNGAKVAVTDLNSEEGEKTLSEFQTKYGQKNVIFQKCDTSSQEEMEETFKNVKQSFRRLNIVVNNAGVGFDMQNNCMKPIEVNPIGTFRGTTLGMEHMRKDKGGKGGVIINIASMTGFMPSPYGVQYAAIKSVIILYSLEKAKSLEAKNNGVRINVLAPAFVDTGLMSKMEDKISLPPFEEEMIAIYGVMTPETVAEALFELVRKKSKNGAVLKISKLT